MTLQDFYIANDSIGDYSEITVHEEGTYFDMEVSPLDEVSFSYYLRRTVFGFRVDKTGHWHLLVI